MAGPQPSDLTLAEELCLLAFDERKGKDTSDWGIDPGLAGALLLELAVLGCIEERAGDVVPVACPDPADPLLAQALEVLRESKRPHGAKHWVGKLPASSSRSSGGWPTGSSTEESSTSAVTRFWG